MYWKIALTITSIDFYRGENPVSYLTLTSGPGVIFDALANNDAGGLSASATVSFDSVVVTYDDVKRQIYYDFKEDNQLKTTPCPK